MGSDYARANKALDEAHGAFELTEVQQRIAVNAAKAAHRKALRQANMQHDRDRSRLQ